MPCDVALFGYCLVIRALRELCCILYTERSAVRRPTPACSAAMHRLCGLAAILTTCPFSSSHRGSSRCPDIERGDVANFTRGTLIGPFIDLNEIGPCAHPALALPRVSRLDGDCSPPDFGARDHHAPIVCPSQLASQIVTASDEELVFTPALRFRLRPGPAPGPAVP